MSEVTAKKKVLLTIIPNPNKKTQKRHEKTSLGNCAFICKPPFMKSQMICKRLNMLDVGPLLSRVDTPICGQRLA